MEVVIDKRSQADFRVEDVYDLAANIGMEFERLIANYGEDTVKYLSYTVISALEHLEASVVKNETNCSELLHLQSTIKKMESDRLQRAEFRARFEHEIEQIEDNWLKETNKLSALVSKLQDENQRLSTSLAEKESYAMNGQRESATDDVKLAETLKELVDEQRTQLLAKDKELIHKSSVIENLLQEAETLSLGNRELNVRLQSLQSKMALLVEEKSDLQGQVQDQQRELQFLQKKLGVAMKENMDLSKAEADQSPDLRGKIVIDKDDPNRPRFTLDEYC